MPLPEKSLITRIRKQVPKRREVVAGIGDDCAVLAVPQGHEVLVTTDFSLEGTHFRREWYTAEMVGHNCLLRGLSDIAAMGGEPAAAFLSLALPVELSQQWVDDFMRGLLRLAKRYKVTLAGGDTAQSGAGVLADIAVLGYAPRGTAIRRSGARPGDRIYVTGELGGPAAALDLLRTGKRLQADRRARHWRREPRIQAGRVVRREGLASAMIDISDGFSTDLGHICEESNVGAEIEAAAIPRARLGGHRVNLEFALHGGDEYELIFTARKGKKIPKQIAGVRLSKIGQIVRGRGILLLTEPRKRAELEPRGWEHFRKDM